MGLSGEVRSSPPIDVVSIGICNNSLLSGPSRPPPSVDEGPHVEGAHARRRRGVGADQEAAEREGLTSSSSRPAPSCASPSPYVHRDDAYRVKEGQYCFSTSTANFDGRQGRERPDDPRDPRE